MVVYTHKKKWKVYVGKRGEHPEYHEGSHIILVIVNAFLMNLLEIVFILSIVISQKSGIVGIIE
jgi:hypothetical protein